jgi:hypothetical protein
MAVHGRISELASSLKKIHAESSPRVAASDFARGVLDRVGKFLGRVSGWDVDLERGSDLAEKVRRILEEHGYDTESAEVEREKLVLTLAAARRDLLDRLPRDRKQWQQRAFFEELRRLLRDRAEKNPSFLMDGFEEAVVTSFATNFPDGGTSETGSGRGAGVAISAFLVRETKNLAKTILAIRTRPRSGTMDFFGMLPRSRPGSEEDAHIVASELVARLVCDVTLLRLLWRAQQIVSLVLLVFVTRKILSRSGGAVSEDGEGLGKEATRPVKHVVRNMSSDDRETFESLARVALSKKYPHLPEETIAQIVREAEESRRKLSTFATAAKSISPAK